jgi:hypothetical protein
MQYSLGFEPRTVLIIEQLRLEATDNFIENDLKINLRELSRKMMRFEYVYQTLEFFKNSNLIFKIFDFHCEFSTFNNKLHLLISNAIIFKFNN